MRRLNVEGAAEFLGVSRHTVRRFVRLGVIGYYRVGRKLVFDAEELLAWMKRRRVVEREGQE